MKKLIFLILTLISGLSFGQHLNGTDVRLVGGSSGLAGTNNGTFYFDTASGLFQFRQGNTWVGLGPSNLTFTTLTDGATITWSGSNANATVTLGGTGRTLTISSPVNGTGYYIKVIQDGTGSRTITTWPTNTKWPSGIAPTLTTTANAVDIISFVYDGTNFNATYNLDLK